MQPARIGARSKAEAQCTAKSKRSGVRCRMSAIRGSTVCIKHGGALPTVKAAAQRRLKAMLDQILDPQRVLAEIACVALFDPGDVHDAEGKLLPVGKWPEHARRALGSWDVVKRNLTTGDGATDEVLKIKLWDKGRALELAAKHHALLTEKTETTGEITISWKGEGE